MGIDDKFDIVFSNYVLRLFLEYFNQIDYLSKCD